VAGSHLYAVGKVGNAWGDTDPFGPRGRRLSVRSSAMGQWWSSLTAVNKGFYVAAGFFSIVFLYQFIMSIIGLAGGEMDFDGHGHADADAHADFDADAHADVDGDFHADVHADVDADVHLDGHGYGIESGSASAAAESVAAFRLFSIRALLAFCTMFAWAAAMYLDMDHAMIWSLLYATGWGLLGWAAIILLINWLRRLAETGTADLATCVGHGGTVYLDIPADGLGEVRVSVSGVITMVKARSADEEKIEAHTPVRVIRMLDRTTVLVQSTETRKEDEK
jgi:hypothetical protein